MDKRNERFDIDNRRGQIGERLVGSFVDALADATIEVKTDYRANETGNLYVETHQLNWKGVWKKSGINTSEAKFYSFAGGCGNGFITIDTETLKRLAETAPPIKFTSPQNDTNPTAGRLVKVTDIVRAVFKPNPEGQTNDLPN
jgi:hypothetical protein